MKFTFAPESKPLDGYTIKRAIQRGGFGEVYYALSDAGKEVALKLIHQNREVELRGVSQCLNLKHPNLVTIFDIRTDADGDQWVVMEYVSGKRLDQVVADHPDGMPIEDIQQWLSGIAAGVDYLHDRGIVHRDIKPANIYRENGIVKTGDVGLSKLISPSRRSAQTQSVGTVYYMAPEVARGRYGPEVDVYATGVVLYEMLTGRVPFNGETTAEILMKHLSEQPDLSVLPAQLQPVLAQALEKDPQRRYASLGDLKRDFQNTRMEKPIVQIERNSPEASVATNPRLASTAHRPPELKPPGPLETVTAGPSSAPTDFEDPLTRFFRDAKEKFLAEWKAMPGWMRAAAALLLVVVVVMDLELVIPLVLMGGASYIAFRFIYRVLGPDPTVVRRENRSAVPDSKGWAEAADRVTKDAVATEPPASAVPVRNIVQRRSSQRRYSSKRLTPVTHRLVPMRQRLAELTGSMALAVICAVAFTVGMHFFAAFPPDLPTSAFFAIITILGAWAVLIPSKLWEGRHLDGTTRRLTQFLAGGLVGLAAFALDETLFVQLPQDMITSQLGLFRSIGANPLYAPAFQPTWTGYSLFFGLLFFLRRWWWHADSLRPRRLKLTSLLLTTLTGLFVAIVFAFPSTWAMTWAVAISSVVQLSSVWISPEERYRIAGDTSHVI